VGSGNPELRYFSSSLLTRRYVPLRSNALSKALRESTFQASCVHQVFAERAGGTRIGPDDRDRRAATADACDFERGGNLPCLADGT